MPVSEMSRIWSLSVGTMSVAEEVKMIRRSVDS